MSKTLGVLTEVGAERARQDTRWGEQNYPSVSPDGDLEQAVHPTAHNGLNFARYSNEWAVKHKKLTWGLILLEEVAEVFEAGFRGDTKGLRAELIQVAAVCAAWVECMDRRAEKRP